MSRCFPFPIPRGWSQIAYSDEIAVGEVRPIFGDGDGPIARDRKWASQFHAS
jgi:hypothetical protein